jgi:hypothetical protein
MTPSRCAAVLLLLRESAAGRLPMVGSCVASASLIPLAAAAAVPSLVCACCLCISRAASLQRSRFMVSPCGAAGGQPVRHWLNSRHTLSHSAYSHAGLRSLTGLHNSRSLSRLTERLIFGCTHCSTLSQRCPVYNYGLRSTVPDTASSASATEAQCRSRLQFFLPCSAAAALQLSVPSISTFALVLDLLPFAVSSAHPTQADNASPNSVPTALFQLGCSADPSIC